MRPLRGRVANDFFSRNMRPLRGRVANDFFSRNMRPLRGRRKHRIVDTIKPS